MTQIELYLFATNISNFLLNSRKFLTLEFPGGFYNVFVCLCVHYQSVVSKEQEEEGQEVWQGDEVREAKRLEVEAVQEAESGRLDQALQLLERAVAMAPEYPSVYNNRAQVR